MQKSTDHNCGHELRQILLIEDYGEELIYIKFKYNEVANTLSLLYWNHVEVKQNAFSISDYDKIMKT